MTLILSLLTAGTLCFCETTCKKVWSTESFEFQAQATQFVAFELNDDEAISAKIIYAPAQNLDDLKFTRYDVFYAKEVCSCIEGTGNCYE